MMKSVLILDDDNAQLAYLSNLLKDDFNIQTADNPINAYNIFAEKQFDAILVDVHMPIINGLDFIKSIQTNFKSNTSLFILSSDTSNDTKIQALNLGVKDFLWPDMNKEEIVLRIKNQLNSKTNNKTVEVRGYKDLEIDLHNFHACISGNKIDLTLIEFKILSHLLKTPNKTISREELKEFTWPGTQVLDKTLNTHLTNLRNKIATSQVEIKSIKCEGILLS